MGPLQLLQVEKGRCHQILHQNNPVHQFVIMDADTPTTTSTMALWTGGPGRGGVAGQGTESMERVWGESRTSTVQVLSTIHCYARACNVLLPAPPADLNGVPVFWLLQPPPIQKGKQEKMSLERGRLQMDVMRGYKGAIRRKILADPG